MSIPESDFVGIGDVLQYFIVTYEELPVLWNHTDPNYKKYISLVLEKKLF